MTSHRNKLNVVRSLWAAVFLWIGCLFPAEAQTVGLSDQTGSWRLFTDQANPRQICFAASQPSDTQPKGANRAPVYFYISAWPKDGVKTELSVKLGYPVKKGSEPSLTIGTEEFKLFADGERAYIGDATHELKALEAMKKGSMMIVQATSERGTATTDVYSLAGISQALQKLAASCP